MKRKITAYILTLVLIVTSLLGCGNHRKDSNSAGKTEDKSTKTGRYMEKAIDLPKLSQSENVIKIIQNREKQFELYTGDSKDKGTVYYCYTLDKDMSWKKAEAVWLNKEGSGTSLYSIVMGQDGNYYAVWADYSEGSGRYHITKSEDRENPGEEIKIPFLLEPCEKIDNRDYYPDIRGLQVLEDGNLVFFNSWQANTLQVFSKEGKEIDKIPVDTNENMEAYFTAFGNTVVTLGESGSGIIFYDTEKKEITRTLDYTYGSNGVAYALKPDNTLLAGDSEGIHRMEENGTLWETMVDGALNSMSMPILAIDGLYIGGEETEDYYAVFFDNDGGYKFFHYVFDKNVYSVPSTELTIYSLKENNTIRQAISLFQVKNTDTKVNYVVAMSEEKGNISDYIRALNTELLSGNGADIILLDGLPVESYIEKGVLADISDIMEPLMENGDILSGIGKSYEQDGKVYEMPVRFSIPVAFGKKDAIDSISSLKGITDYIGKSSGEPFITPMTYSHLLANFLPLYEKNFIETDKLSEDKFTEFLQDLKIIAENIGITKDFKYDYEIPEIDNVPVDKDTLFARMGSLTNIKAGKSKAAMNQVKSVSDSVLLFGLLKDKDLDYSSVNNSFISQGKIGLNNNSKNTEISKEFIQFLYSLEVQKSNVYDGFPVNNDALEQWIKEENDDVMYGASDEEGNKITAGWPEKEEREGLYEIAKSLDQPIEINQVLDAMIIEQVLPYFQGDIDIGQAVAAVKTKVNTYLSE